MCKENEKVELVPGINTGVVLVTPKPGDFIAGGETAARAVVLEESGDYSAYLPEEESQWRDLLDSFACVSFSALNNVETLLNRLLVLDALSPENTQWLKDNGYINKQSGKVNASDRFTAKMSGTTTNGNSLPAVADSIRHDGIVPEAAWPWPDLDPSDTYANKWAAYYAEAPEEVKALGKEFAARFDVLYQWVLLGYSNADVLQAALKFGPVQIAASVCSPWSSTEGMPPIPACGCGTGHATLIYGRRSDGPWMDFDHYKSYRKLLASDYCIPYGLQYVIVEKTPEPEVAKPVPPTVNMWRGFAESANTRALQACLQYLTDPDTGAPYMRVGLFGPYGPATQAAVARFQVVSGITDSPQGYHYGPQTRAALTKALN